METMTAFPSWCGSLGSGLGKINIEPRLQRHRRSHHKNNKENEHDIDQRGQVDLTDDLVLLSALSTLFDKRPWSRRPRDSLSNLEDDFVNAAIVVRNDNLKVIEKNNGHYRHENTTGRGNQGLRNTGGHHGKPPFSRHRNVTERSE